MAQADQAPECTCRHNPFACLEHDGSLGAPVPHLRMLDADVRIYDPPAPYDSPPLSTLQELAHSVRAAAQAEAACWRRLADVASQNAKATADLKQAQDELERAKAELHKAICAGVF